MMAARYRAPLCAFLLLSACDRPATKGDVDAAAASAANANHGQLFEMESRIVELEREVAFLRDQNVKRAEDVAQNSASIVDHINRENKVTDALFANDETFRKAINQHRAILGWQPIPKEGE